MERLLSTEQVGGAIERLWFDDATENVRIERVTDTNAILRDVAEEQAATGGKGENMWHIASIDPSLWGFWARTRGFDPGIIFRPEGEPEILRFLAEHPKLSPTGGKA